MNFDLMQLIASGDSGKVGLNVLKAVGEVLNFEIEQLPRRRSMVAKIVLGHH